MKDNLALVTKVNVKLFLATVDLNQLTRADCLSCNSRQVLPLVSKPLFFGRKLH